MAQMAKGSTPGVPVKAFPQNQGRTQMTPTRETRKTVRKPSRGSKR